MRAISQMCPLFLFTLWCTCICVVYAVLQLPRELPVNNMQSRLEREAEKKRIPRKYGVFLGSLSLFICGWLLEEPRRAVISLVGCGSRVRRAENSEAAGTYTDAKHKGLYCAPLLTCWRSFHFPKEGISFRSLTSICDHFVHQDVK